MQQIPSWTQTMDSYMARILTARLPGQQSKHPLYYPYISCFFGSDGEKADRKGGGDRETDRQADITRNKAATVATKPHVL